MRIALITDGIHPYVIGGMQRHSFFIAKYLARNRIFVDLYHTCVNNEPGARKLDIFAQGEKDYIRSFLIPFPAPGKIPGHYLRRSYAYSKAVFSQFKKNCDVDFVYIKGFAGWKLIEMKSMGGQFAPMGVKFHGMNMFQPISGIKQKIAQYFFRPKVKFLMQHADYVFSYGGKITAIIQNTGIPANKIIEISTGIEKKWVTARPPETGTVRKFLFTGRYDPVKGIRELFAAIKNLSGRFPFEFHFIGPFTVNNRLENKLVKYHGVITRPEHLQTIMDSCDILVCPSYSEGMPNVILEAMSRGLAIIATDVGAVNVLVGQNNGWLINKPHPRHIEKAMVEAMTMDPARMNVMKAESINRIKKDFLWDDIAGRLIGKLKTITGN